MKPIQKYMLSVAAVSSILVSCSDKWNEHYSTDTDGSDLTVYEMMKARPGLEKFVQMVDKAGYADILNTSQTFTVWAPDNNALASVDLNDEAEVKRLVANHIARFNNSTAISTPVRMYNGKILSFAGNTFGGAHIAEADLRARNGILHTLNDMIEYSYNVHEYMANHANTSLIAAFLSRFDSELFDEAASTPIDVDTEGNTVYDSVMVSYNALLEHPVYGLGAIAAEDSLFTMIIPDNNAWNKAYEQLKPLFKRYDADAEHGDSITDVQTSLAIMSDLVFRESIADPASRPTLTTTSGSVISNPVSYFAGTQSIVASNGMIYLSSELNLDPTETFQKPIEAEAEESDGRVTAAGSSVYTRVVSNLHPLANEISGMSYVEVSAASASRQPGVTYELPDVLAGEYDVYATFVPACVEDETVTNEQTKLSFILYYTDERGRNANTRYTSDAFVTSGTEVTTIKVAEGFKFPVSDYTDRLWYIENPGVVRPAATTKLYIYTNVSNAEFNAGTYKRRFYLDKVVLKPVQK